MGDTAGPIFVVWDVTYRCPLRCVHCYSESGRRPSRQLGHDAMRRVADAIVAMRPPGGVGISGGEPLLVDGIFDVALGMRRAGLPVAVYTSGWTVDADTADRCAEAFSQIMVSLDGATAEVHDRIRGRAGSFDRAVRALSLLDAAARERRHRGDPLLRFGIDCVVTRSSYPQMADICTGLAPRFPELQHIWFNAVMPVGLASRPGFTEHELLTEEQRAALDPRGERARELRALVPAHVDVVISDNEVLQMRPDLVAADRVARVMHIEPDGEVRAMGVYEGTVGNILTEQPEELWRRAVQRWSDPFVVATLAGVRTGRDWAEAVRRIDQRFGTDEVRARIARRPEHSPAAPS